MAILAMSRRAILALHPTGVSSVVFAVHCAGKMPVLLTGKMPVLLTGVPPVVVGHACGA